MGQGGTDDFFKQLFPALRDAQPIVRVCAADALAACLKIIVDPSRKHHSMTAILCQIYSFVIDGFKMPKSIKGSGNNSSQVSQLRIEAAQHSSLLIVGDMLACVGSFMLPRFDEVCQCVLEMKSHEKEILKLEVVRLIVSLIYKAFILSLNICAHLSSISTASPSQTVPWVLHKAIFGKEFALHNGMCITVTKCKSWC